MAYAFYLQKVGHNLLSNYNLYNSYSFTLVKAIAKLTFFIFLFAVISLHANALPSNNIIQENSDVNNVIQSVLENAQTFHYSDKPDSALIYYKKLVKLSIESKNNNKIVFAYTKLAEFYRYIGRLIKAKENANTAITYLLKPNVSNKNKAYLYNRYAAIEASFNGLSQSVIQYSDTAIKYALASGDNARYASSLKEIGCVYEKRQSDSCIFYYNKAYAVYQSIGDSSELPGILINFARYYHHAKQYQKSLEYSNKGINEFENISVDLEKCDLYFYNEESNHFLGNTELAYRAIQKYYHYDIKQREIRSNKALAELQTKYDVSNKEHIISEQEIALQKEIKNRAYLIIILILLAIFAFLGLVFYQKTKKKNKLLEKLSKQNAFLTEEANHRIKNNLQLIVSLIHRVKNKEDNNTISGLTEIASKIESIASLHQQLYTKEDKELIDLRTFISDIFKNLAPLFKQQNVDADYSVDHIQINNTLAVNVGILLAELSTNSLKHAFAKQNQPKIYFSFTSHHKNYYINYHDNGIGIAKHSKLLLVDLLCKQINATYSICMQDGFAIEISLKK